MKKVAINHKFIGLLLMLGSSLDAAAQFNPDNPPEPQMYYRLTTTTDPSGAGYTSGDGRYQEGTNVWINTSAYQNYTFQYWTLNGEKYSEENSFNYVVGRDKMNFVAHYVFSPSNPQEPSLNLKNRLFLDCSPKGCCSFNISSGNKYYPDNYIYVCAYSNQGYEFIGWYQNGINVSNSAGFNYFMEGSDNVTLEARFVYNPTNPADPSSSGNDPTYLLGDIDEDKIVDITDAVILNGHYINATTQELKQPVADVNRDSDIDISDVVEIIQKYLNNK